MNIWYLKPPNDKVNALNIVLYFAAHFTKELLEIINYIESLCDIGILVLWRQKLTNSVRTGRRLLATAGHWGKIVIIP